VDDTGKNRTVAEFAASRPGTQTPDWQRAVFSHPELMQADNLHPIEAGAELRARLIAQGVMACLAGSAGASASSAPARPVLADAAAAVSAHLPIRATVDVVRLIAGTPDDGPWLTWGEFPLGAS
jgi:hypothetical protein